MNEEDWEALREQFAARKAAMPQHIVAAHRLCSRHKALILASKRCGCFYCLQLFPPEEINCWLAGEDTAICPRCGIDSVLPENPGAALTVEFLQEMKRHWFSGIPVSS